MMKAYLTEEELQRLAKEAATWVSSPAGKEVIQETLTRSREARGKLEEAHKIDPMNPYVVFTL